MGRWVQVPLAAPELRPGAFDRPLNEPCAMSATLSHLVLGAGSLALALAPGAAAQQYDLTDLSLALPPATLRSASEGLNEQGDVAIGFDVSHGWWRVAVWSAGAATMLPQDGNQTPSGIDGAGNVGGVRPGQSWGWLYRAGSYVCVPEPSWCSPNYFYASTRVHALNQLGWFTGTLSMEAPPGSYPAFLPANEAYLALPTGTGTLQVTRLGMFQGLSTAGWGLNQAGDVVGAAGPATSSLAVLFRGGAAYGLPDLGGPLNRALGISDQDLAVGFVALPGPSLGYYPGSGAVWDVSDPSAPALTAVGQLDDSNRSWLNDVNGAAVAVGFASKNEGSIQLWQRAIHWTPANGVQALDDLLTTPAGHWQLTSARSVNEAGQIAATGRFQGSPERAVLLTPRAPLQVLNHHRARR